MNKFIIFAFVALAAGAASAQELGLYGASYEEMTQFSAFGDDDTETAKLSEDKQIFRDFCLQARDDVKDFLRSAANNKASSVFTLIGEVFASTANKVGEEGAKAVESGNQMIVEDARNTKSALGLVGSTFLRVAKGEFTERINEIKAELNGENVVGAIQSACNSVALDLKPKVESALSSTKKDLARSPAASQFADVIKATNLANLGCLTTARLTLVSRGCQIMGALLPTLSSFVQ